MNHSNFKENLLVWAIDPAEGALDGAALTNLESFCALNKLEVQPVHIFDGMNSSSWQKTMIQAEDQLDHFLKSNHLPQTLPPKVLLSTGSSLQHRIDTLLRYCEDLGVQMISVNSRGRNAITRLLFGSFTESLLAQSPYPLLLLAHGENKLDYTQNTTILFPTDFSKKSREAFELIIKQSPHAARITLFYAIAIPAAAIDSMVGIPDDYIENQKNKAESEGKSWIEFAIANGLNANLIVENVGLTSSIAPAIIGLAKKISAFVIAMASHGGQTENIFFGSVARDVFKSGFPVWICGPQVVSKTNFSQSMKRNTYEKDSQNLGSPRISS